MSRRRKTGRGPAALVTVVGVAVVWAGAVDGLWWAPLLVGFVIGVILRGGRAIVATAGLVAAFGWALPLAWQALHDPIGKVAAVVAGILGLGTTRGPSDIASPPSVAASCSFLHNKRATSGILTKMSFPVPENVTIWVGWGGILQT